LTRSSEWFEKAAEMMEQTHLHFAALTPQPTKIANPNGFVYRFVEQNIEQFVLQKLARIVTGLRSAHLLIDRGFLQEAAILQRSVDEAQEDTLFIVYAKITGEWTPHHKKYLENFWLDDPMSKTAVVRPHIRDYISSIETKATKQEPKEVLKPIRTIYSVYSGYAHAASVHVMELLDGNPPKWQLRGSPGSPFQKDQIYDIRNQYFRGATAFALTALLFNDQSLFLRIMAFTESFMQSTDHLA
jgi:hypothetical protein